MTARLRIALTNVTGLGASQLVQSLLPAFEGLPGLEVESLYLPVEGALAAYRPATSATHVSNWKRTLPKSLSRILECTLLGGRFNGTSPLLVLGDLPVRTSAHQTVFVQTAHLIPPPTGSAALRYAVARKVFNFNLSHVNEVLVQTGNMRDSLLSAYRLAPSQVHVVAQPPPIWLLDAALRRASRTGPADGPLRLFYPAAGYPHKTHRLLADAIGTEWGAQVADLQLTLPVEANPQPSAPWIRPVGRLQPDPMLRAYAEADALLFLSKAESFGFPIVEAMWIGLPVVAPDLPYARALCGRGGIYFDPDDAGSLLAALRDLRARLAAGWWPDWSTQLAGFPRSWGQVAAMIAGIAQG